MACVKLLFSGKSVCWYTSYSAYYTEIRVENSTKNISTINSANMGNMEWSIFKASALLVD